MSKSTIVETDLLSNLIDTLRSLPDVRVGKSSKVESQARKPAGYEIGLDVQIADRSLVLLILMRQSMYPNDVQRIIWQLLATSRGRIIHTNQKKRNVLSESAMIGLPYGVSAGPSTQPVPMLVASSISVGARALLREQGVSYFDSSGSLFIQAPGSYVFVDKPPPKDQHPSSISLFTGKRATVAHALLVNHERWFGGTELSRLTTASTATVSQVLHELERLDWVETQGQGPAKQRRLREPGALLDAWTAEVTNRKPPALRRYYVPGLNTQGMVEGIANAFHAHEVTYAITHEMAAQRLTPYLTSLSQVRIRLTSGARSEKALAALGARVVSEGANLIVIDTRSPTDLQFRQKVDEVWLASPIQIYLDLIRGEGRAKDLAEHFRRERIGF